MPKAGMDASILGGWTNTNPDVAHESTTRCARLAGDDEAKREACFGGHWPLGWRDCFEKSIRIMPHGATDCENEDGTPMQWMARCKNCHQGEIDGFQFQLAVRYA